MDFYLKSLIRVRIQFNLIKKVFGRKESYRSTMSVSTNSSYLWNVGSDPWNFVMTRLVILVKMGNCNILEIDFIGLVCRMMLYPAKKLSMMFKKKTSRRCFFSS